MFQAVGWIRRRSDLPVLRIAVSVYDGADHLHHQGNDRGHERMRVGMDYEVFKNELKNYKKYQLSLIETEQIIDDIIYQYAGVRGIRYDKIPMSFNDGLAADQREKLYKALSKPQKDYDITKKMIERIESNLNRLDHDMRMACVLLFCEGYTYEKTGEIFGYSGHGLWQRVRKAIEKI